MKLFSEHKQVLFQSQWGEDGIIEAIFDHIGSGGKTCVEFGAADGIFCSNTAHLWGNKGWMAYLFESDPDLFGRLEEKLSEKIEAGVVFAQQVLVERLDDLVPEPVDLVSMDIDGLEYSVLYDMQVRHRVLVIEHNPTVPPHMLMRGGQGVGSSARSLIELAERKGYKFLTATLTNLFFVVKEEFDVFEQEGYNFSIENNFDRSSLNYIITGYKGQYTLKGLFPYGLSEQQEMETFADIPEPLLPYLARQDEGFSNWALSRFKELPSEPDVKLVRSGSTPRRKAAIRPDGWDGTINP